MKLEPVDQAKLAAAIVEVNQLYRPDSITFDEKSHVLNPADDASGVCLDGIEEVLKSHSVELGHNWWTHCKASY